MKNITHSCIETMEQQRMRAAPDPGGISPTSLIFGTNQGEPVRLPLRERRFVDATHAFQR
jgi:hypothetical protein